MKLKLLILAACTYFTTSVSGQLSERDSLKIISEIEDWNTGWKTKDYKTATQWYSAEAEFTNAFGHHRKGKAEIRELIKTVFQLPFVMAGESEVAGQKMISITDDVVLVITFIERKGQMKSDNSDLGTRHTTHHRIFRKSNDWLIVSHLISDARETGNKKL